MPIGWRINWPRFWTGFIWGIYETAWFGWNLTAHSNAELICDGIGFLILALSFERFPDSASATHSENDNG